MARAWTNGAFAGCFMFIAAVVACTVSVDDDIDDIDEVGGASGGSNVSGSGGASNSSGSGGSAGSAGAAGTMSLGNGGNAGGTSVPTPVCTAETGDDACLTCLKQQCCTQWQACDDVGCQTEREDITECVSAIDAATSDDFAECNSMFAVADMLPQENTNDLFTCVNTVIDNPDAGNYGGTRCGTACFGTDIFIE